VESYLLIRIVIILLFSLPCWGGEKNDYSQKEHQIFRQIKCMICKGQSIDESDTIFASDVRNLVAKKLAQGQSQEEIFYYLIEKYGEEISLSPPFNKYTLLLWIAPIAFFAGGLFLLFRK